MRHALDWVRARDPGFVALRRAGRGAIVMPALFAVGDKWIANPQVATFAAFGSFALLLLVDFQGPMRERLLSQAALALGGAALVCVGTLASRSTWLAVAVTAIVGFGVLFAGVVSSVIASATLSLLLAFILPVSLRAPASAIPDRLAGWGLAAGASLLAISLLWPAPAGDRLRASAIAACRALASRLRAEAAFLDGGPDEREPAIADATAAVAALHATFYATPYRPTGLSTTARAVVRLVDEIFWLAAITEQAPPHPPGTPVHENAVAVKSGVAEVLERGAALLAEPKSPPEELRTALEQLRTTLARVEETAAAGLQLEDDDGELVSEVISALDPGFRAQELRSPSRRSRRTSTWRRRPSGEASSPAWPGGGRRAFPARSRPRASGPRPTSSRTPSGSTTAFAARPGSASLSSSRASRESSTRSGSCWGRCRCCARTR